MDSTGYVATGAGEAHGDAGVAGGDHGVVVGVMMDADSPMNEEVVPGWNRSLQNWAVLWQPCENSSRKRWRSNQERILQRGTVRGRCPVLHGVRMVAE